MSNFFPVDVLLPNSDCTNVACVARQADYALSSWAPHQWTPPHANDEPVVHEDNDWGIACEGEPEAAPTSAEASAPGKSVAAGLVFQYDVQPAVMPPSHDLVDTSGQSLEQLMAEMAALSGK